mmetsp:Transcript_142858/g.372144  ORF Transcript_142858/g.372144 Transcript_142858/m.372144 type:complete len:120 (+) Transcript_142858:88-447(+)
MKTNVLEQTVRGVHLQAVHKSPWSIRVRIEPSVTKSESTSPPAAARMRRCLKYQQQNTRPAAPANAVHAGSPAIDPTSMQEGEANAQLAAMVGGVLHERGSRVDLSPAATSTLGPDPSP